MTKFRTQYDLQGYNDNEVYVEGTSETEPGQAVNIKSVYLRCLRGELPPVSPTGGYDVKPGMSIDEAFATMDPTESEGFDFADVTAISNALAGNELSTTSQGAEPQVAQATEANAVGNSESAKSELE